MIRVLVAEDSMTVARLLMAILNAAPDFEIVGHAKNGREAVRMAAKHKPDLITMDIRMPVMDGFEATRMIMASVPTPIVVISSRVDDEELRITFRAIEEGALAVVEKPLGPKNEDWKRRSGELLETLRSMAEIKVVGRRRVLRTQPAVDIFESGITQADKVYRLVALGSSTGGPLALLRILSALPIGFPVPTVVVQHISTGFTQGLVGWLEANTLLRVKVAEDGEALVAGVVYFAPDDNGHLAVARDGSDVFASLVDSPPVNRFRPSVTSLFESVAREFPGHAIGGLLTGMGSDGAEGLKKMRAAKCHTFVQDEESSIVYGMPGTALTLNAADRVVNLENIAEYLTGLVRR